ncbi:DoxX family protein [Nocardia sp. NPDC051570]|uniref:DoxX family protein n=1 Tax=Nocardia sp. NPDC051570 TaxID=3364324 RepID=UPI003799D9DD
MTRIVFRFTFLYFGLICLAMPLAWFVYAGWLVPQLASTVADWPGHVLGPLCEWVGRHVFGVDARWHATDGGDRIVDWILLFCVLAVAVFGTVAWSVLDRRRREYRRLGGWFALIIRLVVAGQMFYYGTGKLIPDQMQRPALSSLLQSYGDLTPMGVLWAQVGSSPVYEILLGGAEMTAGILLFVPRTAIAGALLALIDMAMVFTLDMTFDVDVKIWSGHLMLMSLVLLAPEARRLANVLVLNRTARPSTAPYPFHTVESRRIAAAVQVALCLWVSTSFVYFGWKNWSEYGDGRPKPPLYGIWTVQEFTRDGQAVPPLLTDPDRWQRIVFDDYPGFMEYQRMDGTLVPTHVDVDTRAHRLQLTTADALPKPRSGPPSQQPPQPLGTFTFQQSSPDRLRLDGELEGHPVTVTLERFDENRFPQRSRGFHWSQEYSFF